MCFMLHFRSTWSIKMGLSAGIRRPVLILCRRINNPIHSGFGYNTAAHKTHSISEFRENRNFFPSDFPNACCGLGILSRSYSIDVSASEQVNLIKQLRGRTSAPIKDVKSALIDSNWDIGKSKKLLWLFWVIFYFLLPPIMGFHLQKNSQFMQKLHKRNWEKGEWFLHLKRHLELLLRVYWHLHKMKRRQLSLNLIAKQTSLQGMKFFNTWLVWCF